jgi:hypothetical protein
MRQPDFVPRLGYAHPDQNDDPLPDPFMAADFGLTHKIAEVIERHYFGQPFSVKVSHEQGIVQIQIAQLMGAIDWWVVHINDLQCDPNMRCIVRACGEILERFNIPRCAYDREAFIAANASIPLLCKVTGRGFIPA